MTFISSFFGLVGSTGTQPELLQLGLIRARTLTAHCQGDEASTAIAAGAAKAIPAASAAFKRNFCFAYIKAPEMMRINAWHVSAALHQSAKYEPIANRICVAIDRTLEHVQLMQSVRCMLSAGAQWV
jgi:hypothetical protein